MRSSAIKVIDLSKRICFSQRFYPQLKAPSKCYLKRRRNKTFNVCCLQVFPLNIFIIFAKPRLQYNMVLSSESITAPSSHFFDEKAIRLFCSANSVNLLTFRVETTTPSTSPRLIASKVSWASSKRTRSSSFSVAKASSGFFRHQRTTRLTLSCSFFSISLELNLSQLKSYLCLTCRQ